MRCLIAISQDEPELARAEIEALTKAKLIEADGPMLIYDMPEEELPKLERLAYTKRSTRFLFKCHVDQLDETMKSFDWNSSFEESFLLRCTKLRMGDVEKRLADLIWERLDNPKVDLKEAKTKYCFMRTEDTIYCGILISESYANFEYRRNKYKPRRHPTTMHPKFARMLINLSGITEGRLLDPFCGAGGILIEGSLLGFEITGYDIIQDMLNRCEENLYFFGIKKFTLRKRNAANIIDESDLIVTDVPYGKNSKVVDSLSETYKSFLDNAYNMTKRIVAVFPHYVDYKSLFGKWKLEREYSVRCHGGLTRKITILRK